MVTTKAEEMIAWALTWVDFFAAAVADDNAWYATGGIDGKDAADLGDGLAEVARLLTEARTRLAILTAERDALEVQRDRLRRYAQAVEAYEATVGDFPEADLPTLSDWLTERAAIRDAARQSCLALGDLEDV